MSKLLSVTGIDDVLFQLRRASKRVEDFELPLLKDGADKLVKLARTYAPIDEGNLEKAINKKEDKEGPRRRIVYFIGIDENKLGRGFQNYGFPYHIFVHETDWIPKPDSKTMAKAKRIGLPAGGTAPNRVGSKYLERAASQIGDWIEKEARKRLKRLLRDAAG